MTRAVWDSAAGERPCPEGVEGLHFHTLCEQDADPLVETFHGRCEEKLRAMFLPGLQVAEPGRRTPHHPGRTTTLPPWRSCIRLCPRQIRDVEVYLEPGEASGSERGLPWSAAVTGRGGKQHDPDRRSWTPQRCLSHARRAGDALSVPRYISARMNPIRGPRPAVWPCPHLPGRGCDRGLQRLPRPLEERGSGCSSAIWRSIPPARTTPSTECRCPISGRLGCRGQT